VGLVTGALAVTVLLALWALTLGSYELSVGEVVGAIFPSAGGGPAAEGSSRAGFIVMSLRLPRILASCLVGAALGMSGAIFQGLVRNPLAAPDVIGVNAGASVLVVFWIVRGFASQAIPAVAFAGALLAALAVYGLSWRGKIDPARLILVGIGINALATAGVTALIVRGNINEVGRAYQWMAGSLYAVGWTDVRVMAIAVALLLPIGAILIRSMRVLQMGDHEAQTVGIPVERIRLALLVVACGLAGGAVSVTGPIGFVALMTPHVARMIAGTMTAGVFALSGTLGSVLLLGSDMVAQHALPVALPVGVLTAAFGAPYFLLLLYRSKVRI